LIVTRLMQTAEPETALEQSWLLAELRERFGLSLEELARRFGHSVSWVSRRLALLQDLPEANVSHGRDTLPRRLFRAGFGAHAMPPLDAEKVKLGHYPKRRKCTTQCSWRSTS
jgi:hypothetical protein